MRILQDDKSSKKSKTKNDLYCYTHPNQAMSMSLKRVLQATLTRRRRFE